MVTSIKQNSDKIEVMITSFILMLTELKKLWSHDHI